MAFPPIMSMFRSGAASQPGSAAPLPVAAPGTQAPPEVAAAQQTAAAGNPTVPSTATPQSTGSVPAVPVAATGSQSPLDKFKDLWNTDPKSSNTPPQLATPTALDPAKLQEAAGKLRFTQHVNADLMTKATSGDAAAMIQVIEQASQLGFAQALAATNELINQSMTRAQGALQEKVLPAAIRQASVTDAMQGASPLFANPAAQPMLAMLANQFQQQYPTAQPSEIANLAKEYLGGFAQLVVQQNGGQVVQPSAQGSQGSGVPAREQTDWAKFFGA